MQTKHLDLGCGRNPRNPYNQNEIYGIDVSHYPIETPAVIYKQCDLSRSRIPYPDNFFDSISAFDFLEHIPRVHISENETRLPYIELMNEIYRVLKPDGKFIALTPAFPKTSALTDPTHVNIITKDTHKYFTKPHNWAQMYGFNGSFRVIRTQWVNFRSEINPKRNFKQSIYYIFTKLYPPAKQHLLWELAACKN